MSKNTKYSPNSIFVGIVEDIFVEVAGFHNYILSNLVQVGFDIAVESKLAMALGYSKSFEEDTDIFVEGIVEESLVAKAFLVPHTKNLLFLVLLPLDSFAIISTLDISLLNGFLCKDHIPKHYLKDILLMHAFFYTWDKRLQRFVHVLLSFCLLSKHLLVSLMYLED